MLNVVSIMKQQKQYSFYTDTTVQYIELSPNGSKADWNTQVWYETKQTKFVYLSSI